MRSPGCSCSPSYSSSPRSSAAPEAARVPRPQDRSPSRPPPWRRPAPTPPTAAAIPAGAGGGDTPQAPGPLTEPPASVEEPAAQTPEELGYPAFATANTTRVGGPDPASNAAAVALAAYPSGEQRPQAVTLVDGNDWRSAVSAAVLMAPPLGAPLLVSTAAGPPEPTEGALEALDPEGGG